MEEEDFYGIDLDRLEEECVRQPELIYKAVMELAQARKDLEQAKVDLELTGAELDRDIRRNPARFGLEKVTETVVEKTVTWQVQYQNAQRTLLDAKHAVDVLQAAVTALEHRKKSVELSVQLWAMAYFGEPKVPREARTRLDEDGKQHARSRGRNHVG